MAFDSDHARALSRSLHDLSLPEPPLRSKKKHKRHRSAAANDTFISAAIVPTTDSTEVLSSLINSLTVLSNSAREQLRKGNSIQHVSVIASPKASRDDSYVGSGIEGRRTTEGDISNTPSDEDIAEAPIIGYARGRPKTPLRLPKENWTASYLEKEGLTSLGRPSSSRASNTPRFSAGIGIPSIERPGTSATNRTFQDTVETIEPSRKSPLKMLFSSRGGEAHIQTNASYKDKDIPSPRTIRSRKGFYHLKESSNNHSTPVVTAVPSSNDLPKSRQSVAISPERMRAMPSSGSSPEYTRHNPLSPAHREDLSEHLIPSRNSSLRHSPVRTSSRGKSSSASRRPSSSSRDFKSSTIESQPMEEEEDATTRRIKELQLAREKRHFEWSKESKRTERAMKRISLPDAGHRPETLIRSSTQPIPSSIEEIQRQQPESATIANPSVKSLRVTQTSGGVNGHPPLSSAVSLSRSASLIKAGLPPAISSAHKHKRVLSGTIRKSSSVKKRESMELKSVSEQVDAFLNASRLTQRVRNPRTGRTIAFSEVGDPNGFVVFVCVGMGLTRYVTSFYDEVARTQKLRLITPDRPGSGESSPFGDENNTPLAWVDDMTVICHSLNIERFSLLAHSAGAIYALATALKMPQYVRGRIHLLAPWIPPSQMAASGTPNMKSVNLPTSHKILSMLPAPFLKAANSRFLSATSASLDTRPSRRKDRQVSPNYDNLANEIANDISLPSLKSPSGRASALSVRASSPSNATRLRSSRASPSPRDSMVSPCPLDHQARAALYNKTLTHKTWTLATTNANPATDLIICLERRRKIGFMYRDVTRPIVIHHGRKDSRVPLENVRWLESILQRCELRIIEDEEHGLMGSAKVMSEVLCEIGQEWEEWNVVARDKERRRKVRESERSERIRLEREKFVRTGNY